MALRSKHLAEFIGIIAQTAVLALGLGLAGCSAEEPTSPEAAEPEQIEQSIILNAGFQHEVVATGLSGPTAMAIAPDGRIFVAQKTGAVRVVKNGATLTQPFASFTVDSLGERGLVGLTLDPNFASNGYVYVFYNTATGGLHNRISRLTASGDIA
ncbi:MAG TPA: PQQ-dependent sugar dehydrogenase, partial [Polyangiaceae bacterium]|nr:PQQ-dependent sugar dehydrogenase [Polyangiaceae bacterium]